MDAEHLKKKFEKLYNLSFKVRHFQIRYLRDHASLDLEKAKKHQRELDKFLMAETELKKSLLQELF